MQWRDQFHMKSNAQKLMSELWTNSCTSCILWGLKALHDIALYHEKVPGSSFLITPQLYWLYCTFLNAKTTHENGWHPDNAINHGLRMHDVKIPIPFWTKIITQTQKCIPIVYFFFVDKWLVNSKHFCPRIFDTYYFSYRWCDANNP